MANKITISVIIPVSERHDRLVELYGRYREALESLGESFEIIIVLDGPFPDLEAELDSMNDAHSDIRIVKLSQSFGEAATLSAGFEQARGSLLLTLPAYWQVEPSEIGKLVLALEDNSMIVGCRWPRIDSWMNRLQANVFHRVLNFVADCSFRDLGSGVRLLRKEVADEIPLYGDQHRFLPLLAERAGFRVKEVEVKQSARDSGPRVYRFGVYLRRLLDILTVFFLVKFTKKPLRFFGLIGSGLFAVGGAVLAYVVVQRLFFSMPLADRPALLLSCLLVVLGVQLFALGLIGELVIFAHGRDTKEYKIEYIRE